MIKVNMSDMKSKKEVSEAMEKQISEFGDIAKQLNKRMQPMILRMQKTAESAAIKYGMLESDFDEFMSQYERYFWKRGFITPKHFDDFFSWLCGCRWAESNEPFGAMEIKESDFTLYHEYKELKLNPSGWNDHQERERLEDRFNPPPQQNEKPKPELTINQIALKYVYSEIQITRENGNKIAKEYGHNSGEKLFQRFTYYSSAANRKGKPNICTPKKLNNKIELLNSVVELLPTDKQERAKDEVSILKKIYEAEYQ